VIVGTSYSGTAAALGLSKMAESLGADGVMVTRQAEAVPSEDRIFEYYRAIGEGIGIPLVVQDHPASTGVHMSVGLMAKIVAEVPNVACIKEEATPTPPKIRALKAAMKSKTVPVLTGLGALYGQFDLEAGSSGFNTGFAFPEVLQAMVRASSAGDTARVRELYTRFLPLIVFEQQPGVAVRKEILRLRGLIQSSKVRHPGADIPAATAEQLRSLLAQVLPEADITRPLAL
jgi:4-hydroxy-tetrahydrodipicolinate synthase